MSSIPAVNINEAVYFTNNQKGYVLSYHELWMGCECFGRRRTISQQAGATSRGSPITLITKLTKVSQRYMSMEVGAWYLVWKLHVCALNI